jgi:hypothetical protein
MTIPTAWKVAETMSAGKYFGAVLDAKASELTIPAELFAPTKNPVMAALPFSLGSLLLCHVWKRQDGAYAPDVRKKQAK